MLHAGQRTNEAEIHDLLSNERRRYVIEELTDEVGIVTLRGLAERIARIEVGGDPPRDRVRSVYNSLHQTHLPRLDDHGVVAYDSDRKTVRLDEGAQDVRVYMEVVTRYGITWAQYYQWVACIALVSLLAVQLRLPVFDRVDPVLLTSGFLFLVAGSVAYQLWSRRWFYLTRIVEPTE
jgi:hypothetical protein